MLSKTMIIADVEQPGAAAESGVGETHITLLGSETPPRMEVHRLGVIGNRGITLLSRHSRIVHKSSSRSGAGAGLTRRATPRPAGVLAQYAEERQEAQRRQHG